MQKVVCVTALLACLGAVALADIQADPKASSLRPISEKDWSREKAAHLLRRAGFGGTPEKIDELAALSLSAAVDRLVDFNSIPYDIAPPPIDDELFDMPDRAELRQLSKEAREAAQQERRKKDRRAFEELRLYWLERMIESPRPFEEKMVLFWHGHFTSGYREVQRIAFMKEQDDFLRRNALANFKDLLLGISRDRAMLIYLDGRNNVKSHPNENYARELMELFSLGVGNYTENDVKEAARAFTGWTFTDEGFIFRPRNHDDGPKQFLGQQGNFNGEQIIDIILAQPACPRWLARKLLVFFCVPDPDRKLIDALAAEIRKHKYEIKPVMKALFKSEAFYSETAQASLVKSPTELVVCAARQFGLSIHNLVAAERALAQMGQELLQPPNVKGWPGGKAWINSATLFLRYNTISTLINGGGGRPKAADNDDTNDEMMMKDGKRVARSRMNGGAQPAYDPLPLLRNLELKNADQIVEYYANHLLVNPLDSDKRTQLVNYLSGDKNSFSLDDKQAAQRIRMMLDLLCSTPEYQLN